MTETATKIDPTATEVKDFLFKSEGDRNGIYYDDKNGGYPTHGIGVRLDDKNDKFLQDYINSFYQGTKKTWSSEVKHYEYVDGKWDIKGESTILAELKYLLSHRAGEPFGENSDYPEDEARLKLKDQEDWEGANIRAFEQVAYAAYLGGVDDGYDITGVRDVFKNEISVWNNLTKNERLALYSLNYNSPVGPKAYIGPKMKNALRLYTSDGDETSKLIGKMEAWYQVLYNCNAEAGNISKGIQNRRFMEACAFMGEVLNSLPTPENAHCSLPVTDDFDNVNLVVAFMNARWQGMKDKLLNIPGYKEKCYRCMQTHFTEAVRKFLKIKGNDRERNYSNLFSSWNLYTELGIAETDGMPTGTTAKKVVVGTELDDVIYASGSYPPARSVDIYCTGGNNEVHCGPTDTRVEGGSGDDEIYSYQGNDVIFPGNGNNLIDLNGYPIWKKVYITNSTFGTDRIINFDPVYHDYDYPLGYLSVVEDGNITTIITEGGNKIIVEQVKY